MLILSSSVLISISWVASLLEMCISTHPFDFNESSEYVPGAYFRAGWAVLLRW